jgi:hypothetical protein
MKYTIEVTPNGITKTFEFEGKKYVENWTKGENGIRFTTRSGISTQLEKDGILDEYDDYMELFEALEMDDLDQLWDEMKYYQEENGE